jgi:hypothetical protein
VTCSAGSLAHLTKRIGHGRGATLGPLDEFRQIERGEPVERAKGSRGRIKAVSARHVEPIADLHALGVGRRERIDGELIQAGFGGIERPTPRLTICGIDHPDVSVLRCRRKVNQPIVDEAVQAVGATGNENPLAVVLGPHVRVKRWQCVAGCRNSAHGDAIRQIAADDNRSGGRRLIGKGIGRGSGQQTCDDCRQCGRPAETQVLRDKHIWSSGVNNESIGGRVR